MEHVPVPDVGLIVILDRPRLEQCGAVQALVLLGTGVGFLGVEFANGVILFVAVEVFGALSALGIGVVLSVFAENGFQAIQFIPLVITPQVVLGGTFREVAALPVYLEYPAPVFPITHLVDAMEYVVLARGNTGDFAVAVAALVGFATLSVLLAALDVLPRR